MIPSQWIHSLALSALLLGPASAVASPPTAKNIQQRQHVDAPWISLSPQTEFQAAGDPKLGPLRQRLLEDAEQQAQKVMEEVKVPDREDAFANSYSTIYDPYQTAWRYMGFYMDCGAQGDNDNNKDGGQGCQRYLLWAAYVDLGYQGGGLGEYQIMDVYTNEWQKTACEVHGGKRCVHMDCHDEKDSGWSLLGYYKNYDYYDFFEQLFKHQGYCIWGQDEDIIDFMYGNYESWPQGCSQLGNNNNNNGDVLYYDLKPIEDGNMTLGIYTDAYCTEDYELPEGKTVDDILGQNNNRRQLNGDHGGLLLGDYQRMWNDYLSVFKVCQPCKAYALHNVNQQRRQLLQEQAKRQLEDGNYDWYTNEGYFVCYDVANYYDVNQCMKFATHTDATYATVFEVFQASEQGSLLTTYIDGELIGHPLSSTPMAAEEREIIQRDEEMLKLSIIVLLCCVGLFLASALWARFRPSWNAAPQLKEPLVDPDDDAVSKSNISDTHDPGMRRGESGVISNIL